MKGKASLANNLATGPEKKKSQPDNLLGQMD